MYDLLFVKIASKLVYWIGSMEKVACIRVAHTQNQLKGCIMLCVFEVIVKLSKEGYCVSCWCYIIESFSTNSFSYSLYIIPTQSLSAYFFFLFFYFALQFNILTIEFHHLCEDFFFIISFKFIQSIFAS